jgi:hypothetical protein
VNIFKLTGPGGFYLAAVLLTAICHQNVEWRRSHPEFRSSAREIGE